MQNKIFYAIIILYNPESLELSILNVENLRKCNIQTFIYDNSQNADIRAKNKSIFMNTSDDIQYFDSQGENNGLSYAYNSIINYLLNNGVDHNNGLFFFDQDSEINIRSILNLLKNYNILIENNNFGLISGFPIRKNKKPYRIRVVDSKNTDELIEVYQTSSSFSLIPLRTFVDIGLFQKDFFIDYIDMDFCMRCRLAGKKVFMSKNAVYVHEIGIGNIELMGKFLFPYGHPQRHYYQVRNMILSLKRSNQLEIKIIKEIGIRLIIIVITGICKGNFRERINFFLSGVKDAVKNKGGKL